MAKDKKVQDKKLVFILTKALGQAFIARDVAPGKIRLFLQNWLSEPYRPS